MYIAMNRFIINQGKEAAFEDVWRNRDSSLKEMPGFREFHLLKGPVDEAANTTLYASHTIWDSKDAFVSWTKSQNFKDAHKNAGTSTGVFAGHPVFEGFEAVLDA